jgi:hypothetical protein
MHVNSIMFIYQKECDYKNILKRGKKKKKSYGYKFGDEIHRRETDK